MKPESAIVRKADIPPLRAQMIWVAACSLGARGGLARRAAEVRLEVDKLTPVLDKMSFQPLMSREGMLPPVLTEERDVVKQESKDKKRSSGVLYRMQAPARFVSVAPTWRDYLYIGLDISTNLEMPNKAFLPKSPEEEDVWRKAVAQCWQDGVGQANLIFSENLNRFRRDYNGMIRYRVLADRGMVEQLVVSTENKAVTGNGDTMAVDDQTYRIERAGGLIPDNRKWR